MKPGAARPTCAFVYQAACGGGWGLQSSDQQNLPPAAVARPRQRLPDACLVQVPSTSESRRSLPTSLGHREAQAAAPSLSDREDPLVSISQFTRACA